MQIIDCILIACKNIKGKQYIGMVLDNMLKEVIIKNAFKPCSLKYKMWVDYFVIKKNKKLVITTAGIRMLLFEDF